MKTSSVSSINQIFAIFSLKGLIKIFQTYLGVIGYKGWTRSILDGFPLIKYLVQVRFGLETGS